MNFIAEVGSNWWHPEPKAARNLALSAIREAAWANATIVKFQVFQANSLYARSRPELGAKENRHLEEIWERTRNLELDLEFLPTLVQEAHREGLKFWASFFAVDLVEKYGPLVDGLKIASGDLDNYELLEATGRVGKLHDKALCLSTGAGTWGEIQVAIRLLAGYKSPIVLHCVSAYPAEAEEMNLATIQEIGVLNRVSAVGLSDHSADPLVAQLALGFGASYFEKHFRPEKALEANPDFMVSGDRFEFRSYTNLVNRAQRIIGRGKSDLAYQISPSECNERVWARRGDDGLRPRA